MWFSKEKNSVLPKVSRYLHPSTSPTFDVSWLIQNTNGKTSFEFWAGAWYPAVTRQSPLPLTLLTEYRTRGQTWYLCRVQLVDLKRTISLLSNVNALKLLCKMGTLTKFIIILRSNSSLLIDLADRDCNANNWMIRDPTKLPTGAYSRQIRTSSTGGSRLSSRRKVAAIYQLHND
jgi:hypothetical protein